MPQATTNYQQKQLIQKYSAHAAALKRQGYPEHRIIQELLNQGLDRDTIRNIVDSPAVPYDAADRDAARRKMISGGLVCIFGILATVVTYGLASANGGGTYIIAFGMILGGGYRFLRGLSAYSR